MQGWSCASYLCTIVIGHSDIIVVIVFLKPSQWSYYISTHKNCNCSELAEFPWFGDSSCESYWSCRSGKSGVSGDLGDLDKSDGSSGSGEFVGPGKSVDTGDNSDTADFGVTGDNGDTGDFGDTGYKGSLGIL